MSKYDLILFGDSLTAGYYQYEITDLLTKPIAAAFPELSVRNAGIPGETAADGLRRVEQHVVRYHPKWATVFFGANDIVPGMFISATDYRADLEKLIELIGPEKVILIGVPFISQRLHSDTHGIERLEEYNEQARDLSNSYQIPFLDMLHLMQTEKDPTRLWQGDGVHFSKAGYDFFAKHLIAKIKEKIASDEGEINE